MASGTLALWLVGILWALFAAWVWISLRFMENASKIHGLLHELSDLNDDKAKNIATRLDAMQAMYDEQFRVLQKACAVGPVERRVDELEQRTAGVEALLVSTVGQETEDFCQQMDAIMGRMKEPDTKPEQKEKLTLSEEHVGRFEKPKEAM